MRRIVSSFALVLASGAPARAARPASGAWTGTVARSTPTVSFCRPLKYIARGRFTSTARLTGCLEEQAAGCVGGLPWRAHRRG